MLFDTTCPYNCKNGKLFNRATRKMEVCPHCKDIRERQLRGEIPCDDGLTVQEKLRIPESYMDMTFAMDKIIPKKFSWERLTPDSMAEVEEELQKLLNNITLGELPDRSMMFSLGECADFSAYIYPLMLRAFKTGLKVTPVVYSMQLQRLRSKFEQSMDDETYRASAREQYGDSYTDYIDSDVCIAVLDAGASLRDLYTVRGLIDNRANARKPTLIFTYAYFDKLFTICAEDGFQSLRLPKLVQVRYKRTSDMKSRNIIHTAPQYNKREVDMGVITDSI